MGSSIRLWNHNGGSVLSPGSRPRVAEPPVLRVEAGDMPPHAYPRGPCPPLRASIGLAL